MGAFPSLPSPKPLADPPRPPSVPSSRCSSPGLNLPVLDLVGHDAGARRGGAPLARCSPGATCREAFFRFLSRRFLVLVETSTHSPGAFCLGTQATAHDRLMVPIALAAPRCLLECAAVAPATLGSVRYTVLYSAHALSLPSWPFGRRLPAHLPTCGRAKPMPAWSRGRQTQTAPGLSSVAERHPSRSTPPVLGWPPLHP